MQNTRPFPSAQKRAMSASLRRLVTRRAIPTLAVAALLGWGAHSALADTYAFTGTGGTNPAAPTPTPSNFTGGFTDVTTPATNVAPASATTTQLTFGGSAAYTANADTALTLNSMTFINSGNTTITGSLLTFGGTSAGITNNGTGLVTISAPYTSSGGTSAAPDFSYNGTGTVTVSEAAANTIGGFIGFSGGGTVQDTTLANPFGSAGLSFNGATLSLAAAANSLTNTAVINGTNTLITAGAVSFVNSASNSLSGSGILDVQIPGTSIITIGGTLSGIPASSIPAFSGTIALTPVAGTPSSAVIRLNNTGIANVGSSLATFDLGQGAGQLVNRNGNDTTSGFSLGALLGGTGTALKGQNSTSTAAANLSTYLIGGAAGLTNPANVTTPLTDEFDGTIQSGSVTGGTTAITKVGVGTLVLTNNNSSYTAGTTISSGNLQLLSTTGIASATTSSTGAGTVTENATGGVAGTPVTAVLSGTGVSVGALTVGTSADANDVNIVAPGVNTAGNFGAAGTLSVGTTGGTTLTNAVMDYDLSATGDVAGAANPANDTLVTGGALSIGADAFNFNELTGALQTGTPYTLISGATSSGFAGGSAAALAVATTFTGGPAYTPAYNLTAGNNLQVTFAAAPEPGQTATMSLIGVGMFGLFLRARKRRMNEQAAA